LIAIGKAALRVAAAVLFLYLVLVGTLFWFQRDFFYPAPETIPTRPEPGFDDIRIRTSDGLVLRAFHHPARAGLPTLLFFHGNASDLDGSEYATRLLVAQGYGVLAPEYRGYGGNPGSPDEQGLYRDGEAALAWLAAKGVPASDVVAIGNSLGSGVATEMASRHHLAGLVLISGFASLPRVSREHYPFVPAGLLVLDRYDNFAKIAAIHSPILLLHGTSDTVASADNSRAMVKAQPSAQLILVPGVGHELAFLDLSQSKILAWLRSGAMTGTSKQIDKSGD
jgi:pimeloyl-ACP methyl ester carboxylesterase